MFFTARRVHFVGIGGSGMSGIAEVLLNLHYEVSGSDQRRSAATERLKKLGARIWEGHSEAHVEGAEAVVVSSAVKPDNPEVLEARRRQIPVIPRGEMLAELMRLKYGIAVAGSHGKTTTTSMVAAVLAAASLDPTLVVGGRLNSVGSSARLGKGEFIVVESDESDRSFLHLAPILALITTIDREHLDCYGSFDDLQRAYAEFANRVPFYGAAILCTDDPGVRQIVPMLRRRVVAYGTDNADLLICDIQCGHMESKFALCYRGQDLGRFQLAVPGRHNALNAAAAVAVGLELKISLQKIRQGLADFRGVERRFQVRGEVGGVTVVDDYGHHPTEIRATLAAARECKFKRVIVLFQPHRHTRTALLMDEFAHCFELCDRLYVGDIYGAGESPIEGVTAAALVERIQAAGFSAVEYGPDAERVLDQLAGIVQEGDAVITLGAGNVWQLGDRFLQKLRARQERPSRPRRLATAKAR
jgi:UDP-N-acetylmuramate--alanine ligase